MTMYAPGEGFSGEEFRSPRINQGEQELNGERERISKLRETLIEKFRDTRTITDFLHFLDVATTAQVMFPEDFRDEDFTDADRQKMRGLLEDTMNTLRRVGTAGDFLNTVVIAKLVFPHDYQEFITAEDEAFVKAQLTQTEAQA